MVRLASTSGFTRCFLWLAFCLLAVSNRGHAEITSLKVFPLQHRTVQEVLPVVAPLVGPEGAVTGQGFTLIVRASPTVLQDIERVLAELDSAPRLLRISVRQGRSETFHGRQAGAEVALQAGEGVRARLGDQPPSGGGEIRHRTGNLAVRGGVITASTGERDSSVQQVTTLDGQEANIAVGLSVPYPVRVQDGLGRVQESLEFRDVLTGFIVQPRLSGDQVTVAIRPQAQKLSEQGRDSIDIQQMNTVVRGRLGEWLQIGGMDSAAADSRQDVLYRAGSATQENRTISLKVELVE